MKPKIKNGRIVANWRTPYTVGQTIRYRKESSKKTHVGRIIRIAWIGNDEIGYFPYYWTRGAKEYAVIGSKILGLVTERHVIRQNNNLIRISYDRRAK